jgi:hypothetical protein
MGMGDWLRGQTEHCMMAVRGNPAVELTNQTTVLHGKVREHSRKPDEFYSFVESLCPSPRYAYLFSRRQPNDRWDCHGDEAPPANDQCHCGAFGEHGYKNDAGGMDWYCQAHRPAQFYSDAHRSQAHASNSSGLDSSTPSPTSAPRGS